MSLQVWLPFNGNFVNQGISDLNVTNSGVTINSNGKIGKCSKFDGNVYLRLSKGVDATQDYSVCYWVKEFGNNTLEGFRVVYQCGSLIIGQYGSSLYIYNNSGSGMDVMASIGDSSIWHHACYTFSSSDNIVKIYLDGNLATTKTVTSIPTTASTAEMGRRSNGTYYLQAYINDFRIYDHCLSAKEVKEISKGLCLHYQLKGFGAPNLVKNSLMKTTSSAYGFETRDVTVESGKQYAFSVNGCISDAAKNDGTTLQVYLYKNDWSYCPLILGISNTTNTTVTGTFTANQSTTLKITSYSHLSQSTAGSPVTINWYKLEEDSKATPWCPNSADSLYSSLGFNSTTEPDCSGFGNNGIKTGTLICNANSPRYSSSYNFIPSSRITSTTGMPVGSNTVFTVNFWLYITSGKTFTQWGDFIGFNGNNIRLETSDTSASSLNWYNYPIGSAGGLTNFSLTKNTWNMITLVCDGSKFIQYLNGSLLANTNLSGTAFSTNGSIWIGDTTNMYFNISDLRIYATALSATDIKELYNSPISIDKSGNIYAYEYQEV